jgi:hypothetical protein
VSLHILWKGAPEFTLRLCSTSSILQANDQCWEEAAAAFLIDPLAEGPHLVHESEGLSVTEGPMLPKAFSSSKKSQIREPGFAGKG